MGGPGELSEYELARLQYLRYYKNQPLKKGGLTSDEWKELGELEKRIQVTKP